MKTWSSEREAEIIRRYTAGERGKVIAWEIGITYTQYLWRVQTLHQQGRLPLRNRAWRPCDNRAVLERRGAGEDFATIAAALGRTEGTVRTRWAKLRRDQRAALAEAQGRWAGQRETAGADDAAQDRDQFKLELRAA